MAVAAAEAMAALAVDTRLRLLGRLRQKQQFALGFDRRAVAGAETHSLKSLDSLAVGAVLPSRPKS